MLSSSFLAFKVLSPLKVKQKYSNFPLMNIHEGTCPVTDNGCFRNVGI
uniref:Uncharacterized protein n=1 Tax=Anguilla anguilla TaxID=7936 RepID=A0A0E9PNC0_ANGAN